MEKHECGGMICLLEFYRSERPNGSVVERSVERYPPAFDSRRERTLVSHRDLFPQEYRDVCVYVQVCACVSPGSPSALSARSA